jgi:hypothetical protein
VLTKYGKLMVSNPRGLRRWADRMQGGSIALAVIIWGVRVALLMVMANALGFIAAQAQESIRRGN